MTDGAAALVVVDLYGSTRGTDEAIATARASGLMVVEDAAQALGAVDAAAEPVGRRADVTTFSLYATKNITAGEGGVVMSPDASRVAAARRLRNHGGLLTYQHETIGLNYRMPEMAAALARSQLGDLETWTTDRRGQAAELHRVCHEAWGEAATVPPEAATGARTHVFHQFTVRFRSERARDAIADFLRRRGIDARHFYPYTVAELPGVEARQVPCAERLRDTVLSIPVHPGLTDVERSYLLDRIRESAGHIDE
jgi:dTDP-4-amino-4,6-dideoxygalactose transaminase